MARAAKLKVYRTAIGFHDAYVAAPSQKAALAAWGSDKDLFARGAAELVSDEGLMEEPLTSPGKVIRRLRGSTEEQIAALPSDPPKRQRENQPETSEPVIRPKRTSKAARHRPETRQPPEHTAPTSRSQTTAGTARAAKSRHPAKPRPSRKALDEAEQVMRDVEARHSDELADLRHREEMLKRERRDAIARQGRKIEAAADALAKAEQAYRAAITAWATR